MQTSTQKTRRRNPLRASFLPLPIGDVASELLDYKGKFPKQRLRRTETNPDFDLDLTGYRPAVMLTLMENTTCSVDGCNRPKHLRTFCIMHYQRFMRHGDVDAGRPPRYGEVTNHPLHKRWLGLRKRDAICSEWRADFWAFVEGIGIQPDKKRLQRIRDDEPLGPDNFRWAEPLTRERALAYYREWNRANPDVRRVKHLSDKYGITLSVYDAMFKAQGGKCAICKREEGSYGRRGNHGGIKRLAVDHNHETGEVRGLLCDDCNVALGSFGDDPLRIMRAIVYLKAAKRKRFRVVK